MFSISHTSPGSYHPCDAELHRCSASHSRTSAFVGGPRPPATAIADRTACPYRAPVVPEEINREWAANLMRSAAPQMVETVDLATVLPQLCDQGVLTTSQHKALVCPHAGSHKINREVLSILQREGTASTFACFLNILRSSTDPVVRQWFQALADSELFVVDRAKQLDKIITTEYSNLYKNLPARDIADCLWLNDVIGRGTRDRLQKCESNPDAVIVLFDYINKSGPSCWDRFIATLSSYKNSALRKEFPKIEGILDSIEVHRDELYPTSDTVGFSAPVSALRPSPVAADETTAVLVEVVAENDINPAWRIHFSNVHFLEILRNMKLTSEHLLILKQHDAIPPEIYQEAERVNPTGAKRKMLVLRSLKDNLLSNKPFATFLNLLALADEEEPTHQRFFHRLVSDPKILKTTAPAFRSE